MSKTQILKKFTWLIIGLWLTAFSLNGQPVDFSRVHCEIHFDRTLQDWDGFGHNYVEVCQMVDLDEYREFRQDYGGFSILSQPVRDSVLQLIFGEQGLKVGLIKMFMDPLHEELGEGHYDHATTTKWMRYFVKKGLKITRERGGDLQILTTMYGPPPWATLKREMRARDLDTAQFGKLAGYLADWLQFLREDGIPVGYISLHNQGDKPYDFPLHGGLSMGPVSWNGDDFGWDYNGYWPPRHVVSFVKLLRPILDQRGLQDVGITPGETSRWHYFQNYGYAYYLSWDEEALNALGLITSHGFHKTIPGGTHQSEWFGEQRSAGLDLIHEKRPELHAWSTSCGWLNMDAFTVKEIYGNIYTAKVNGYIPWAGIHRNAHWKNSEANDGAAIYVNEDGTIEVLPGYYYYKQVTRAGQPGMKVAATIAVNRFIYIIAFSSNGSGNPDSFVVMNLNRNEDFSLDIHLKGTTSNVFEAFRTNDGQTEQYRSLGKYEAPGGIMQYEIPRSSVTTFFGIGDHTKN